jgi:hypothetical protein
LVLALLDIGKIDIPTRVFRNLLAKRIYTYECMLFDTVVFPPLWTALDA